MNHRIATLKLRSAILTACGGIVASCVFACSGDDTTPVAGNDSGGAETSTQPDSGGTDGAMDSTTPVLDASLDVSVDVSVDVRLDALPDVRVDAAVDAALDAAVDAGLDGAVDATMADAEAGVTPLPPLDMCPTLDADYAVTTDGIPADDYSARATTWSPDISGAPSGFAQAVFNDCRVNGMTGAPLAGADGGTDSDLVLAYLSQLNAWTLQFMGCGLADAGALSYSGLIPANAAGHVFTLADFNVLSSLYEDATITRASFFWGADGNPTPSPISVDQIDQIQAQLNAMAAAYPGVNKTSQRLTYSTCPDAGAEGGTNDAGGDGGADASGD
jgi:hypothetical protein